MSNTQNQIICPECNTAFSLDESHYALISQQVRTKEFNKELDKKVQLELTKSLKIKENELTTKHTEELNQKDKILAQLRNDLKLIEEQNKNNNQALIEKKDKEIHSFKSMLKLQETQNQIKINEAVKLKDQEINQLKNDIKLQESKNQIQTQFKRPNTRLELVFCFLFRYACMHGLNMPYLVASLHFLKPF